MKQTLLCSILLLTGLAIPLAASETRPARANFILHCSGCHGLHGAGTVEGGIPAFANSVGHIAEIDTGRTYMMHVPGVVSNDMTDVEIAEVLNYILDVWGEDQPRFSVAEVTRRRAIPVGDVVSYRRKVVEELRAQGIELAQYPWP